MIIVVTGAAGFVGSHLASGLGERAAVRAMSRRPTQSVASWVPWADVADRHALRRGFSGAACLIHAAGMAHVRRTEKASAEVWRIHVHGTQVAVEEAADAGVEHVVLISSAAAANGASGDPYASAKAEAEAVARRIANERNLVLTILRPPMIYGPRMRGNPLLLFSWLRRGLPVPLGNLVGERSVLYVGNLVHAINALVQNPIDGTFDVTDERPISPSEFAREAASALGRKGLVLKAPVEVLATGAWALDLAGRTNGARRQLARLQRPLLQNGAALMQALDTRPPFSTQEGIAETARWVLGRSS